MTIEIADRLVKLRKKYGYSQEELADKLGLSRQAVSKWERAEASPDTDNLICLAKLYGVSLDELLATDEDIDTIVKEQVKEEEPKKEETESKVDEEKQEESSEEADEEDSDNPKHIHINLKDRVIINNDGIFVKSKDGSSVSISSDGIHCTEKCKAVKKPDRGMAVIGIVEGLLFLLATVAYILLGSLLDMWYNAWVVFFVPEIVCSLARAIRKKNAQQFNICFVSLFAFFFVCMICPGLDAMLWHPMWVVFLAIPVYHTTVSAIHKAIGKKDKDDDDDDDDDEDEDDD